MNWIKIRPDGKGGQNVFNWNMSDVGMNGAVNVLGFLVLGLVFGFALPVLFLIFWPISHNKDRMSGIVTTIVITAYLFIDQQQGWILDSAFNQGGDANLIWLQGWLLKFNLALAFLNVVILILAKFVGTFEGPLFYLFCIVSTYFVWWPMASIILN